MSDLHRKDRRSTIIDRIDDTEVTLTNAVLILTRELLTSGWTRVRGQPANLVNDPCSVLAR